MKRGAKEDATTGDRRFEEIIQAFAKTPKLSAVAKALLAERAKPRRRAFGAGALKVNGKIFAMLVKGRLVVKVSADRAAALASAGEGEPFDPGHGRLMKQWVVILRDESSWIALAKEAHAFVRAGNK